MVAFVQHKNSDLLYVEVPIVEHVQEALGGDDEHATRPSLNKLPSLFRSAVLSVQHIYLQVMLDCILAESIRLLLGQWYGRC